MNEDKLFEILSNCDDDLVEQEIDKLLEGVDIDMKSIHKKSITKLNKLNKKNKYQKSLPYIAAGFICCFGITLVYADDISLALKSFFNKTPIYSTTVEGDGYYLKNPYSLDKDTKITSVLLAKDKLEIEIETKLSYKQVKGIKLIPKDNPNISYVVGGYSEEGNKYFFSFMNATENNYNINPVKDFNIIINEKSYDLSLDKAEKVNLSEKTYTAKNELKGVNVGAKSFVSNGKLNIQLLTSFDDKDLKLNTLGTPSIKNVEFKMENNGNEIVSSCTSSRTDDLYVVSSDNNKYKLEIPKNAKGRPITLFETTAPKDMDLTLDIPSLIASYGANTTSFVLDIPKEGEVVLNKEIDFKMQKANIKKITRTSNTSATIEVDLNLKDDKNISIRSFDFYSKDIKKIFGTFKDNTGVINLEFNENISSPKVEIGYPTFVINGNWKIDIDKQ